MAEQNLRTVNVVNGVSLSFLDERENLHVFNSKRALACLRNCVRYSRPILRTSAAVDTVYPDDADTDDETHGGGRGGKKKRKSRRRKSRKKRRTRKRRRSRRRKR